MGWNLDRNARPVSFFEAAITPPIVAREGQESVSRHCDRCTGVAGRTKSTRAHPTSSGSIEVGVVRHCDDGADGTDLAVAPIALPSASAGRQETVGRELEFRTGSIDSVVAPLAIPSSSCRVQMRMGRHRDRDARLGVQSVPAVAPPSGSILVRVTVRGCDPGGVVDSRRATSPQSEKQGQEQMVAARVRRIRLNVMV